MAQQSIFAALLVAAAIVAGGAQAADEPAVPESMGAMSDADCDKLASIPNAPLSVDACKSMMEMGRSYQNAAADPRAQRPGDDAMNCAEIMAEMSAMRDFGGAEGGHAETGTSLRELTAMMERHRAENAALMAQGAATMMGAAAIDTAVTVATGGIGGGIASQVASMQFQAQAGAQAARQQAEAKPVHERMSRDLDARAGELTQSMQANPRAARLGQLGMRKNCQPSDTPDTQSPAPGAFR